jgi:HSP20 family protein
MTLLKKTKGTEVSPVSSSTSVAERVEQPGFFRDYDSIFDEFRRSFNNLMRPFFPMEYPMTGSDLRLIRYAPTDLVDEGDRYVVHVELPGLSKEDIEVNINNEGLSIRGQKKVESEEKEAQYLHRERYYTSFARDISFPEEVDPDKADGSMDNGILELTIPKKEPRPEERPRKIEIH